MVAFKSTTRAARFRARKVQDESFDSSLSRRDLQEACLMAESERGAPKYLDGKWDMVNTKILAIFLCLEGGSVKEEELRFRGVNGSARGIREEGK